MRSAVGGLELEIGGHVASQQIGGGGRVLAQVERLVRRARRNRDLLNEPRDVVAEFIGLLAGPTKFDGQFVDAGGHALRLERTVGGDTQTNGPARPDPPLGRPPIPAIASPISYARRRIVSQSPAGTGTIGRWKTSTPHAASRGDLASRIGRQDNAPESRAGPYCANSICDVRPGNGREVLCSPGRDRFRQRRQYVSQPVPPPQSLDAGRFNLGAARQDALENESSRRPEVTRVGPFDARPVSSDVR